MAQIALTTVFTPPASCFDNSYTLYGSPVYVKDVQVQSLECYPEGFRALWSVGEPFSPGVCPKSYVGVSSQEDEREGTRVLCCPGEMTAHNGEMGCFTEVHGETILALPTGVVTVKNAMLAMHGVLVAWASSDLTVLPAMPGSSPSTRPVKTTSDEQHGASTTPSDYGSSASSATSRSTLTPTPLKTTTEATTEKAESQISDTAGDATPFTQDTLTPSPSPSPTSVAGASPTASNSITPQPAHHLSPSSIAGISIGAAASIAILAGLAASAILLRRRRRRRRARAYQDLKDFRVFDTASEFHEDKRRWSQLPSSFGTASGRGSGQTYTEVSEADSRAVGVSELEGN